MFAESVFPWLILDFNTSKTWVDYFAAIAPTFMAFIAVCVAAWQLYVSNKQKNINQQQIEINKQQLEFNKQQMEIQRCNFVYSSFIHEKQNKLLELRQKYLLFKEINLNLLGLIFPNTAMNKNFQSLQLPDVNRLDKKDIICAYYIERHKWPADLLEKAYRLSREFYEFLENNQIFLQDNPELFIHLKTVSYAFSEYMRHVFDTPNMLSCYHAIHSKITTSLRVKNFMHYIHYDEEVYELREDFYNFMHMYLMVSYNGVTDHLLYMPQESIFKTNNLIYSKKDVKKWAINEKIAFHTSLIFNTWFTTWVNYIDEFFTVSFEDIKRVQQYAKK